MPNAVGSGSLHDPFTVSMSTDPVGCFQFLSIGKYYFNTHSTGNGFSGRAPYCKHGPTEAPTAAPTAAPPTAATGYEAIGSPGSHAKDEGTHLGELTYTTLRECEDACQANSQCKHFTACPADGNKCYLKTGTSRVLNVRDARDCQMYFPFYGTMSPTSPPTPPTVAPTLYDGRNKYQRRSYANLAIPASLSNIIGVMILAASFWAASRS
jgi:hypothetical protein